MSAPDVVRLSDLVPAVVAVSGLEARTVGRRLAAVIPDAPFEVPPDTAWVASVLAPTPVRARVKVPMRTLFAHFSEGAMYFGLNFGDERDYSADAVWLSRRALTRLLADAGLPDPWAPAVAPAEPREGVRDRQIRLILETIRALGYPPRAIPDGGKAAIRGVCVTQHGNDFTRAGFEHAWKAARERQLVELVNVEQYRHARPAR